jgi:uncharacterized protein YjiS (DUF1127 family)
MSVYASARPVPPLGSVATFRVVTLIERAGLAAWRTARATESVLARLPDQQLADIGLDRGQISETAARLARR